jgi:hypothetical protein
MNKVLGTAALAFGGFLLLPAAAQAAVTFDSTQGTGFVGKGDVQLAFGWNNNQLQNNAGQLTFRAEQSTVKVTESSWSCTNTGKNVTTQERERTTTTTITTTGVVSSIARDNGKQITGFNLTGYASPTTASSSTTEGPPLNSCPTGWVLTPAGDPTEISESTTGTLSAVYNGTPKALLTF